MPDIKGGPLWFLRDNTPEVVELLHKQVSKAVRKTALDIQAKAQTRAPVATGFLKSSIYTVTSQGSSYGHVEGEGTLLPEVSKPQDDQTAYIAVGAEYGVYVEYGTSRQAAQPYLQPAFDAVVPTFLEAMKRIEADFPLFSTGALASTNPGTEE